MWTIRRYDTVGSTNDVARDAGVAGAPGLTAFVAREQTNGRGRRERAWASPDGGLWMSLLLRPAFGIELWSLISLATGLAVAKSLRDLGLPACLKWPNDVQVRGRKIAGILCESVLPGTSGGGFVVVGIGLNVNIAARHLPEGLRSLATSISEETRLEHDIDEVAGMVMNHLYTEMGRLEAGDPEAMLGEWRSMCPMLGQEVIVRGECQELAGIALDVSHDGALIVESAGASVRVVAADVSVRLRESDEL